MSNPSCNLVTSDRSSFLNWDRYFIDKTRVWYKFDWGEEAWYIPIQKCWKNGHRTSSWDVFAMGLSKLVCLNGLKQEIKLVLSLPLKLIIANLSSTNNKVGLFRLGFHLLYYIVWD